MGEIGRSHREFLYEFTAWQLRLVIRGYHRRSRDMWSAIRWQTYNLMCVSMADIKKVGIYRPTDLLKFPWEDDTITASGNQPTDEEIENLRRMMQEENARIEAAQQSEQTEQQTQNPTDV